MNLTRHVVVQRRHHLVPSLQQRGLYARMNQVFRHLQADKAAADDHRVLWFGPLDLFPDGKGVLHRAQGKNAGAVDARQGRPQSLCARRQNQLIVSLLILASIQKASHPHRLSLPVNGQRLVVQPHIDVKPIPKALLGLKGQRLFLLNHSPDIVRQSAVGVRHIAAPLQNHNLRRLVQAAQSGRRGGPSGHSADNQYFHNHSVLRRLILYLL